MTENEPKDPLQELEELIRSKEGRLKQMIRLKRKLRWDSIGQFILGGLTAILVLGIMFLLFLG
jgi:uncharacterized membrane protein YukC